MESPYHSLTVQLLFCAKHAQTDTERERLFRLAEKWSMRALKEDQELGRKRGAEDWHAAA